MLCVCRNKRSGVVQARTPSTPMGLCNGVNGAPDMTFCHPWVNWCAIDTGGTGTVTTAASGLAIADFRFCLNSQAMADDNGFGSRMVPCNGCLWTSAGNTQQQWGCMPCPRVSIGWGTWQNPVLRKLLFSLTNFGGEWSQVWILASNQFCESFWDSLIIIN